MTYGIITRAGEFIGCDKWNHVATALRNNTSMQFLLCRQNTIDIVGDINRSMYEALVDYCISNSVLIEDVISSDLEDQINSQI